MNIPNSKETFEKKLNKNGPLPKQAGLGRCWLWTGKLNNKGYGVSSIKSVHMLCHRIAFTLFERELNPKEHVLHHCDRPACCRPSHLFTGNHNVNMQDMWDKGRHPRPEGERNNHSKLTADQVREIRLKYQNREMDQVQLSREYGVHQANISSIIRRQTWKHVA